MMVRERRCKQRLYPGSLLLNESSSYQVCARVLLNLVVLQATDRPIHFEHSQRDLVTAINAVFTQRTMQLIHADVFPGHVGFYDCAVMHQQSGLAFDQSSKALTTARNISNQVIQN